MNNSLITADGLTHIKILAVSLVAALLVIWIGMSARWIGSFPLQRESKGQLVAPSLKAGERPIDTIDLLR
jgi:hypothetical protein